ncbi:hypothetical protein [Parachitinimonas caeni]|uniref:Methanolan biosynthesis EpsI domain-containing protein n=1 Tax=Parachitinimonas caeni TaxID=3031301 RepID=A0ABT7E6H5_9NEIS|nr:hypothetical protein [Parachitinimonas caeni]MDK2126953.1 hypothetical protein [Parachitinimonas caeni]
MKSFPYAFCLMNLLLLSQQTYGVEGPSIGPAPVEFGQAMQDVDAVIEGQIVAMRRQYRNTDSGKLFGTATDLMTTDCTDRPFDKEIKFPYSDDLIVTLADAKVYFGRDGRKQNPQLVKELELRLNNRPCEVGMEFRKILKNDRWLFLSWLTATPHMGSDEIAYAYLKHTPRFLALPTYPEGWRYEPKFSLFADGVQPVSLLDTLLNKMKEVRK